MKSVKYISMLAALAILLFPGCAGMRSAKLNSPVKAMAPVEFPRDYKGMALVSEPEKWEEAYGGGTYLFNQGRYDLALTYFLRGVELATGEARRTCLVAAAVSALGANDNERFLETRKELEESMESDPFREPTETDHAINVLFKIHR